MKIDSDLMHDLDEYFGYGNWEITVQKGYDGDEDALYVNPKDNGELLMYERFLTQAEVRQLTGQTEDNLNDWWKDVAVTPWA